MFSHLGTFEKFALLFSTILVSLLLLVFTVAKATSG